MYHTGAPPSANLLFFIVYPRLPAIFESKPSLICVAEGYQPESQGEERVEGRESHKKGGKKR